MVQRNQNVEAQAQILIFKQEQTATNKILARAQSI